MAGDPGDLSNRRNFKAASIDHVPCELYKICCTDKDCSRSFSKAILKLFDINFSTAFIPNEWKDNIVVLIHKKGSAEDLDNYRGITLINTLNKILCKVLAKRLELVNSLHSLIRKEQIEFIKDEEGLSGAAALVEIIQRRKFLGLPTFACFLDLRKASLPHDPEA